MTDLVAANYPSNAARTNAEMKVVLDSFRDIFAEHQGGAARTELTIASGLIVPAAGAGGGTHTVDTEGNAASDDLTNMTTTNVPEGRYIRLYAENAARVVTIKDSAGGAGQFLLADGNDFVFASIDAWVLFQRRSTDLVEVARYVPNADLTAITTLATDDVLEVWDTSANAYKKITQANALKPSTVELLTSGTAATWNTPAGAKALSVEFIAGGGGSGGAQGGASQVTISNAGGGGGSGRKEITSPAASYTYTIGAGGTAGAAAGGNGGTGGTTSFTDGVSLTLSATGGAGGNGRIGTALSTAVAGASGGAATGGDENYAGEDAGGFCIVGGEYGSMGNSGGSALINGGVSPAINAAGVAATVPGVGGGSASTNSVTNRAGADGFRGQIRITVHY
jgi:hypothetical protein